MDNPVRSLFGGVVRWDILSRTFESGRRFHEDWTRITKPFAENLSEWIDPDEVDESGALPKELIARMAKAGYLGLRIPKEYGGQGLSTPAYAAMMRTAIQHSRALATTMAAHDGVGLTGPLLLAGSAEQKRRYLPRLASGELSAFAATESAAGSDLFLTETHAEPSDDGSFYILNGSKCFITNAPDARLIALMATRPAPESVMPPGKELIMLFIDTDTPGFRVTHRGEYMGFRGLINGSFELRDVRVPADQIIPGYALGVALRGLQWGWIFNVLACSAACQQAQKAAVYWGANRVQGGLPIVQHQSVQKLISDTIVNSFALDCLADLCVSLHAEDPSRYVLETGMAKYFASERAWDVVDSAFQLRASRAYEVASSTTARGEQSFALERWLRDIRVTRIWEFSSEVMPSFAGYSVLQNPAPVEPCLTGSPPLPARHQRYAKFVDEQTLRLSKSFWRSAEQLGDSFPEEQRLVRAHFDAASELLVMASMLSRGSVEFEGRTPTEGLDEILSIYCENSCDRVEQLLDDPRPADTDTRGRLSRIVTKSRGAGATA